MQKKLRVLDLFSGIGGFSLGLERTGAFETVAFCEIDEAARKVLRKHWKEGSSQLTIPIFKDVKEIEGSTRVAGGYLNYAVDVICGGFPCQDISVAGKQRGLKGERSGLWREFHRLIKEIQPRYAIIENVANLRSKGLGQVIQDLWEIGYGCEWHIIPADSIGALHKRERIWIIAYPSSQKGIICNSSGERCDGCIRQERHLQDNEERNSEKIQSKRKQCEPITGEDGQILSKRHIDSIRSAYASEWESVSRVHRVVNGISKEMERSRKERIKQLGNAVVPQIPELIGNAIIEYEKQIQ
jgi:DNA (cytosine-5)-methyltransferase 1